VTLKVKYADFQIITRSKTLHGVVRGELLDAAPKGIRLLGITLSSLLTEADEQEPQLSLSL